MQTIRKQDPRVAAVIGKQKPDREADLRLTCHSYPVPCADGTLLFHTMTGELLFLSKEEAENCLSDPRLRGALAEKWFLVPAAFSEKQLADEVRGALEFMAPPAKDITVFTIFSTTDCNARCFYCYEKGRKKLHMSEETAHKAAAYIARVCGGKDVLIRWFGGEPLYNRKAVDIITDDLRRAGIPFTSHMISNGLLFDRETIRTDAEKWNLKALQITLDGTEQNYNRIKAYTGAQGSPYQKVLENIGLLLEAGVNLNIRLNMDRTNPDDLEKLIDELAERFGRYRNFQIYCALLRDWGARNAFAAEDEAIGRHKRIQEKLRKYGIDRKETLDSVMPVINCIADNDAAVTILPDGSLGKCEHDSQERLIGNLLESDEIDRKAAAVYKQRREDIPECESCRHYPRCITPKLCADISEGCTSLRRYLADEVMKNRIIHSYLRGPEKQEETGI